MIFPSSIGITIFNGKVVGFPIKQTSIDRGIYQTAALDRHPMDAEASSWAPSWTLQDGQVGMI